MTIHPPKCTIRVSVWIFLFYVAANSIKVNAQPSVRSNESPGPSRVRITYYKTKKLPTYLGYELSITSLGSRLHSDIPVLNQSRASFWGGRVGGVIGNARGKIKATVGMSASDASMPFTMELYQGAISGSIYLLRLREIKVHQFEPYFTMGIGYRQSKFYGYYLDNRPVNHSTTETPYLGQNGNTFGTVGAGVEYQLETDQFKFLHLFVGITYSTSLGATFSDKAFAHTNFGSGVSFNLGVQFGLTKYRKQ